MSTTTSNDTLLSDMNDADLNNLQGNLSRIKFGNMLSIVKAVVTGLVAAGSHDITTAAVKAAATVTGISLESGEMLPAVRMVRSLRVTAATTASTVGSYGITDASGTAVTANTSAVLGIAKLSDDGKTITWPTADVTAFVIEYTPMPATALSTQTNSF